MNTYLTLAVEGCGEADCREPWEGSCSVTNPLRRRPSLALSFGFDTALRHPVRTICWSFFGVGGTRHLYRGVPGDIRRSPSSRLASTLYIYIYIHMYVYVYIYIYVYVIRIPYIKLVQHEGKANKIENALKPTFNFTSCSICSSWVLAL